MRRNKLTHDDLKEWALPVTWALTHRIIDGMRLQFYSNKRPLAQRPWCVDPLNDSSREVVIMKGRQLGCL